MAGHDTFRSLIKLKWKLYGWKLYLLADVLVYGIIPSFFSHRIVLLLYLFFLTILTISLTLAADVEDPSIYSTNLDMFRLFCEVVVLLGILVDIVVEMIDFCTN